jgi:environmental stress-induced protein Ves
MTTTMLKSKDYTRSPWKNGGGIFTDIADAHRPGNPARDWDSLLWRFASTPIVAPGPFSHMPGIDRLQMVVGGRGLVLRSPAQEFDEREPFTAVRFTGEMEIVTVLEAGPVEVVNLMGRRGAADIALDAIRQPGERSLLAGTHLVYAAQGACRVRIEAEDFAMSHQDTLRIELAAASTLTLVSGLVVVGSIRLVG